MGAFVGNVGTLVGIVSGRSYLADMKFSVLATTHCPQSKTVGSLRKILWGMPDKEPDASKYVIGGCCISDEDPDFACINCDWQGLFGNERALDLDGLFAELEKYDFSDWMMSEQDKAREPAEEKSGVSIRNIKTALGQGA